MKIFVNPGHGGDDPGACGCGLRECDVALNIGKLVAKYLRDVGYDVKVYQFDGLYEICDASNYWNADLFVSIHCNAGGGTGCETFYYESSSKGRKLAAAIQNQLVKSLPLRDRGLKTKIGGGYDIVVTKYTDCPAVLVETAFIDRETDALLLRNRQDDFAKAIARGVTDYVALSTPDVIDVPVDR